MSRKTYLGWFDSVRQRKWLRTTDLRRNSDHNPIHQRYALEQLEERCLLAGFSIWGGETIGIIPPRDSVTSDMSGESAALAVSPFPPSQTFFLHSKPGAEKIIFLDFDGHTTYNTAWNDPDPMAVGDEIPTIVTPPYSTDADGTFTNQELNNIQQIWERVTEDYRPFDVDVTTEDPGVDVLAKNGIRVCIGGSNDVWFGKAAGGVAFIGSFGKDMGPAFVFEDNTNNGDPKSVAEAASHEVGHTVGLYHDGLFVLGQQNPTEYYPGHGPGLGFPTGWAPIMGVGYDQELTQWSKGEYPNAVTIWPPADPPEPRLDHQDDLDVISMTFPYREDDHGDDVANASEMEYTGTSFFAEGIIEENTDLDYFAFTIGVEEIVFDITPFHIGPNLDILAKLHDASGNVLATSNPRDDLNAGFSINTPDETLLLSPGTYYISIDGTGKPFTTDPGYTDYGSLGYFSISGTRKSLLEVLVGVDFDAPSGSSPANWTRYTGGGPAVFSDVKNEMGATTPYNLSISTSGATITSHTSTINQNTIPFHTQPLNDVSGFIANTGDTWTFTWSDLEPLTVYEVYVFGADDSLGANHVEIAGNGSPISFTQSLAADELVINGQVGSRTRPLIDFARTIQSSASGVITITVTNETDAPEAAVAGLAIRPGTLGSIKGQKWNDEDGDGVKDDTEPGLPGWTIYFDDNNNGVLDGSFATSISSVDVPQVVDDYASIKSELLFQGVREIFDLNVTLDITHSFAADLNVFLISPSGTRVELFTDVGGFNDNFTNTTIDDEAATSITAAFAPFTGTFRPEGSLSTFDSENANGIWLLEVTDDAGDDTGILNSWSLRITGSERSTVTDGSGNYSFEDLPPGVYNVREVLQPGWMQTLGQPPVTVSSGGRAFGVNFGNRLGASQPEPGSLAGQKWNDLDGDGTKDAGEPGLPGWTIYLDGNNNGVLDSSTVKTVTSNNVPQAIVDFATVTSQVLFNGLNSVTDVTVTLDITHTFDGDLDAYLISPAGTQVELFSGVGGQFNNFSNTTLDQDAATSIAEGSAPFSGTFRPEGLLSDFLGENPNGIWRLLIRDTAKSDAGSLNSWSLSITGQELSTTTNAEGNYAFLDLVPGDYNVREVQQPGWTQTSAPPLPVVVNLNQQVANMDFGNIAGALALAGDYNGDDVVDIADYVLWRKTMNQTASPPFSGADGDGDGVVDQDDYNVWRAHFGMAMAPPPGGSAFVDSVAASAAFVPAPAMLPEGSGDRETSLESVKTSVASQSQLTASSRKDEQKLAIDFSIVDSHVDSTDIFSARRAPSRPDVSPRLDASADSNDIALLEWLSLTGDNSDQAAADSAWLDRETSGTLESEPLASIDVAFETLNALALR